MGDLKTFIVTVYGVFTKEVKVSAESEDEALDYLQDICDRTDLITFSEVDLVDISAEDVVELEIPDHKAADEGWDQNNNQRDG